MFGDTEEAGVAEAAGKILEEDGALIGFGTCVCTCPCAKEDAIGADTVDAGTDAVGAVDADIAADTDVAGVEGVEKVGGVYGLKDEAGVVGGVEGIEDAVGCAENGEDIAGATGGLGIVDTGTGLAIGAGADAEAGGITDEALLPRFGFIIRSKAEGVCAENFGVEANG